MRVLKLRVVRQHFLTTHFEGIEVKQNISPPSPSIAAVVNDSSQHGHLFQFRKLYLQPSQPCKAAICTHMHKRSRIITDQLEGANTADVRYRARSPLPLLFDSIAITSTHNKGDIVRDMQLLPKYTHA
eukprot:scaffold4457_cov142-Skeletonema_marinoi.AAC.1